ncbi:unnamed protein product [Gadus morhua 'NCC']
MIITLHMMTGPTAADPLSSSPFHWNPEELGLTDQGGVTYRTDGPGQTVQGGVTYRTDGHGQTVQGGVTYRTDGPGQTEQDEKLRDALPTFFLSAAQDLIIHRGALSSWVHTAPGGQGSTVENGPLGRPEGRRGEG